MSKLKQEIQVKVVLKEEGMPKEYEIVIPTDKTTYLMLAEQVNGKKMITKEVVANCSISTEKIQKDYKSNWLCLKLQALIQDLNILSNKEEVQAITESVTTDIEEVVKFVKKGLFHFYPELTVEDIEEGITTIGDENSEEITSENLNAKGYFATSTGIMYIPKESTK